MTRRTRLFIGVAVGVLMIGLGTGLVASYYGLPLLAQFGGSGPGELAYVPRDARLIAFADVREVMDSELRRKIMEIQPDSGPNSPRAQDFFKEAGINIETDIDRVVASLGGGTSEGDRERPLILARGRFDDDLVETLIRQRGGRVEDYKGTRLLTVTDGDNQIGLAFVEPGLVAVGSVAAVRGAVDTKGNSAGSIVSHEEVMALVRDIDSGNAWAVGRFDAVSSRARLPENIASQLPPINWFAASGHVNGGVDGLIRAEARDETAAEDLRQVVQGFLALARLQAGQNEQIRALVNSLQLGGTGKTVSLAFSMPSDVIDALAALRDSRRPAPEGDPAPNSGPQPDADTTPAVPQT